MGWGWLVLLFCTHVCVPLWVLIPKLKESSWNTSMLTSVLVAVGELAQVSGPEIAMYTDDLFSIIIDMLQVCASPSTSPVLL